LLSARRVGVRLLPITPHAQHTRTLHDRQKARKPLPRKACTINALHRREVRTFVMVSRPTEFRPSLIVMAGHGLADRLVNGNSHPRRLEVDTIGTPSSLRRLAERTSVLSWGVGVGRPCLLESPLPPPFLSYPRPHPRERSRPNGHHQHSRCQCARFTRSSTR